MVKNEQLYVSVSSSEYRDGKAKTLEAQASILKILKHYHAIRLLWKEKKLLRTKLNKLFNEVIKGINEAGEKMPVPKAVIKRMEEEKKAREKSIHLKEMKIKKEAEAKAKAQKRMSAKKKENTIDSELRDIQEKLKALGA